MWIQCFAALVCLSQLCGAYESGRQAASQPDEVNSSVSPRLLLQEAYAESEHLSAEERSDVLLALARAAQHIDPGASKQWAKELFQLSFALKTGQNRSAAQKNALVALAQLDPEEAARLFKQQDLPPRPLMREDIRAFGTRLIFPALYKRGKTKALPEIQDLADWLGSTGQYPYVAMAAIIVETAKTRHDDAEQMFTHAVSFIRQDPGFETTNSDVVKFLLGTKGAVSPSVFRYGIEEALASIERAKADKDRSKLSFEVKTDKTTLRIDSEAGYLVYRLMPLIRSIDERWAEQVASKYPTVASLTGKDAGSFVGMSGVLSAPNQTTNGSQMSGGDDAKAMDESRLLQVERLAADNPVQAGAVLQSIGDPVVRATAASELALADTENKSGSASSLPSLEKLALSADPSDAKLRLMVKLTTLYFDRHREKDAESMMARAFDLGQQLFEDGLKAHPENQAYTFDSFTQLIDLSRIAAEQPAGASAALARIRNVQNEILRAHMLIAFADGWQQHLASKT